MLLRHRAPGIETRATTTPAASFKHLDPSALAVLQWLVENRIDFVLVGPVARAIRGDSQARGAVSLVPAPYGRNLDRLARALWSAHARLRVDGRGGLTAAETAETVPVKLSAEKLVGIEAWKLRCGAYDIDVEGRPDGVPRFQELLYEAARYELAPDLAVEVGSPEDIEHYEHVRRTGVSPEIKITRATPHE
jgi:hypothetical protein